MISDNFIWLDRIKSKEELQELIDKAKEDKHGLFAPTFKVVKGGKISGYVSIGTPGFPVCVGWMSTKEVPKRDGLTIMNMVENHVFINGATGVIMPMPKVSPFYPLMEKMGYKNHGTYDFFAKAF